MGLTDNVDAKKMISIFLVLIMLFSTFTLLASYLV